MSSPAKDAPATAGAAENEPTGVVELEQELYQRALGQLRDAAVEPLSRRLMSAARKFRAERRRRGLVA